ncbi:BTAD domain-containing putative transcriptional regulator [Nocardia nova]|uniref:BTAD domain-containing putative transcriptional regulator n=1 Tax=Nocardia nova TaxID=37330 RepID=UPI0033F783EA
MLIAVAGARLGSGVTTTTVALARTWPGPEPVVIVEADPAGGHLASAVGVDPYRGLASMARAALAGPRARAVEFTEHAQLLPGGVAFLASTPGPDPTRAAWTTALLTGTGHDRHTGPVPAWDRSGLTVIADCGAPEPGSVTASILTHADARLIVVHADRDDPDQARHRILALTAHGARRAVLLIAPGPHSDYEAALGLPVMARLPASPSSAAALLHRPLWSWARGNRLLPAARVISTALDTQLRPSPAHPATGPGPARARERRHLFGPRPARPTVYRIELPTDPPRVTRPARPAPADGWARPVTTRDGTVHTSTTRTDTGHRHGNAATFAPQRPASPAPTDTATPATASERPSPHSSPARPRRDAAASAPASAAGPEPVGTAPGESVRGLSARVFGPLRVLWRPGGDARPVEVTRALRPRERELLTLLAVHPAGASRDTMITALWPDHRLRRPANTLNTVISRLRSALATATGDTSSDVLDNDNARYRLNPELWHIDYHDFDAAVTTLRTATDPGDRERACRAVLTAADGVLAEDVSADWIAPIREHARRDRLKALGKLAAMLVDTDPDQTLALLETALAIDPTNEPIYQDIIRLHARLGERTVINPTLALLKRRLESIGDAPTQFTLDIAAKARSQHGSRRDTEPNSGR